MLSEHDWVYVVQCAADRDEEAARKFGDEFYRAYLNLVKQMEEDIFQCAGRGIVVLK